VGLEAVRGVNTINEIGRDCSAENGPTCTVRTDRANAYLDRSMDKRRRAASQ
jgi:hypothetical protein